MRSLLSFILLFSLSFSRNFQCIKSSDFLENNKQWFSQAILARVKDTHSSLEEVVYTSAKGYNEETAATSQRVIVNGKYSMVSKVNISSFSNFLTREIRLLRKFCGVTLTDSEFFNCDSDLVIPFYGCVQASNHVYLFQEGLFKNLRNNVVQFVYRTKESLRQKVIFLKKIAEKFARLHSQGIIHSNINPSCIVAASDEIKDFRIKNLGRSKDIGETTEPFVAKRSYFTPPEVFEPKYKLKPQIDVYGLGMVFVFLEEQFTKSFDEENYEAMNEATSISSDKIETEIKKIYHGKKLKPLREVILKATSKDLKVRYKNAQELVEALDNVIKSLPEDAKDDEKSLEKIEKSPPFFDETLFNRNFWKERVFGTTKNSLWGTVKDVLGCTKIRSVNDPEDDKVSKNDKMAKLKQNAELYKKANAFAAAKNDNAAWKNNQNPIQANKHDVFNTESRKALKFGNNDRAEGLAVSKKQNRNYMILI